MLLLVIMVKCRFACYGTRSSSGLCCFQLFLLLHVSTWKRELQKMSECSERKLIKELFQSSSFLFYTGSPPDLKVGWGTQLLFHRDLDNSQCEECKDFSALGSWLQPNQWAMHYLKKRRQWRQWSKLGPNQPSKLGIGVKKNQASKLGRILDFARSHRPQPTTRLPPRWPQCKWEGSSANVRHCANVTDTVQENVQMSSGLRTFSPQKRKLRSEAGWDT